MLEAHRDLERSRIVDVSLSCGELLRGGSLLLVRMTIKKKVRVARPVTTWPRSEEFADAEEEVRD